MTIMRKSLDQLSMKGKWKHEIQNQYKMCKEFDLEFGIQILILTFSETPIEGEHFLYQK